MFFQLSTLHFTVVVSLLVASPIYGQNALQGDASDWETITAGDKTFSASYPAKPKPVRFPSSGGRVSVGYAWDSEDGKRMFGVVVDPYESPSPEAYLQGVKQGVIDKETLVSSKSMTAFDRPAIELISQGKTAKGTPKFTHKRVVVDTKRVYMVMAMSLGDDMPAEQVQTFFDSFRLLTPYAKAKDVPIARGQEFRHPSIGVKLSLPEGWYITSQDTADFRGESPKKGRRLLIVRDLKVWTPLEGTSFSVNAHPVDGAQKTTGEYQRAEMKELADASRYKMTLGAGPATVVVGGQEFARSEYTIQFGEQTLHACRFDRFMGGYAVNLQAMAPSKEKLRTAEAILTSLALEPAEQ